jgi:hypothetical protein
MDSLVATAGSWFRSKRKGCKKNKAENVNLSETQ